MRHMTTTSARVLARGQKLAGVVRDPVILAIVTWRPGLCRNEIAAEYEHVTGEYLADTSLYPNLRRMKTQGLIRRCSARRLRVLRPDIEYADSRIIYWEPTGRGDRTLDQLTGIFNAVRRRLSLAA